MKMILEFDTHAGGEFDGGMYSDFLLAYHGHTAFSTIQRVDEYCRQQLKYADRTEEVNEALEAIRKLIRDLMEDLPGELRP